MMKKFLTSKEAAAYLGVSEDELQEIISKKKITTYKIGGVYTRFSVDDLNSYRHKSSPSTLRDRIKDFFYFNDFYIFSSIAIIVILYFIFK